MGRGGEDDRWGCNYCGMHWAGSFGTCENGNGNGNGIVLVIGLVKA